MHFRNSMCPLLSESMEALAFIRYQVGKFKPSVSSALLVCLCVYACMCMCVCAHVHVRARALLYPRAGDGTQGLAHSWQLLFSYVSININLSVINFKIVLGFLLL